MIKTVKEIYVAKRGNLFAVQYPDEHGDLMTDLAASPYYVPVDLQRETSYIAVPIYDYYVDDAVFDEIVVSRVRAIMPELAAEYTLLTSDGPLKKTTSYPPETTTIRDVDAREDTHDHDAAEDSTDYGATEQTATSDDYFTTAKSSTVEPTRQTVTGAIAHSDTHNIGARKLTDNYDKVHEETFVQVDSESIVTEEITDEVSYARRRDWRAHVFDRLYSTLHAALIEAHTVTSWRARFGS